MRNLLAAGLRRLVDRPEPAVPLGHHRARVIAVCASKGGVGKTTTAVHLGAGLASLKGRRTLVVDLDPQGHVGTSLRKVAPPRAGQLASLLTAQETREHAEERRGADQRDAAELGAGELRRRPGDVLGEQRAERVQHVRLRRKEVLVDVIRRDLAAAQLEAPAQHGGLGDSGGELGPGDGGGHGGIIAAGTAAPAAFSGTIPA